MEKAHNDTRIFSRHGIINAGGSGGTSLAAEVMRNAVPIGFPKMIVSTIASGDSGPMSFKSSATDLFRVSESSPRVSLEYLEVSNLVVEVEGKSAAVKIGIIG